MNAGGRAVKRSWHKRTERGKRRKEESGRIAGAGKGKATRKEMLCLLDNDVQMVSIWQGLTDERFSNGTGQFQDG